MNKRIGTLVAAVLLGALGVPGPAAAQDGSYLQGVGAVNAAMGGAGVAATTGVLGGFHLNPATLMAYDGSRLEFGFAFRDPSLAVASERGGVSGVTESSDVSSFLSSMGASYRVSDRVALGLGILETGGFKADYPVTPANPVLAPQPEGLGSVRTEFESVQITPTIAIAVSDRLWLGGSLTVNRASLALQPFLFQAPVTSPGFGSPFDRSHFSSALAGDTRVGVGFLGGLVWNINDMVSVGASYNSERTFGTFEFSSVNANPNQLSFGLRRPLSLDLELPAVLAGGVSAMMLPDLMVAADARYLFYEDAAGFAAAQAVVQTDGSIDGLGWENALVIAVGAQYRLSDAVLLRGGYNDADNPVPDELATINVGTASIIEKRLSFGIGWRPERRFEVSASYTRGFENSGAGTLSGGFLDGVSVTNTQSENTFALQFTLGSRGL
ncbi:MAG: outer membrane protein transport protein [Gemmatimonadota bacterium]